MPTVSLHVHERIDPQTIIEAVSKVADDGGQLSLLTIKIVDDRGIESLRIIDIIQDENIIDNNQNQDEKHTKD